MTVTNGAGTITLSGPQDINTTSTPTFGGMTINGTLTVNGSLAVSASTGIYPPGHLWATTLSYSNATTIGIAIGSARSDDATWSSGMDLSLTSAWTKTTGAWSAGTAGGALDSGAVAASTWYYVFLIGKPSTNETDVLLSTSATAPTMPTVLWTKKRRVGTIRTDGAGSIRNFVQRGDYFEYVVLASDCDLPGTAGTCGIGGATIDTATSPPLMPTVSIPPSTIGRFIFRANNTNTSTSIRFTAYPVDHTPVAYNCGWYDQAFNNAKTVDCTLDVMVSSLSKIAVRADQGLSAFLIIPVGWFDTRDRL